MGLLALMLTIHCHRFERAVDDARGSVERQAIRELFALET